jgi:2-iminobutanoate/2-iminopropanoate deaminase
MTRRAVSTTAAPGAVGPYSQAIEAGGLVFCAGQIGRDDASGSMPDGVEAQTEQALRNLEAVLDAAGCTFADVVKTTCFLADINDFTAFNGVYGRFMTDPPPARSTFQVGALPMGARVEIEAIAVSSRG